MVSSLVERALLVPVMRVWRLVRGFKHPSMPVPAETRSVHAPGSDSDRVLLLGSGIAVGWGTIDHEIALAGHLVRALSARTGRGTDLDLVVDASMTVTNASRWLESVALERYDAVVVTLGTTKAFELESVSRWKHQLEVFLTQLLTAGCFDLVVAGIPSLRSINGYGTRLGLLAERQSQRFNEASAALCDKTSHTTFVPLSPALADPVEDGRPTANYRMWGAELADRIAPLLDHSRIAGIPIIHDAARSEPERYDSVRQLRQLHTQPEPRFDRIVEQARVHLNASAAALGFIDGDRIWYKSVIGATLPEIPFVASFTKASLTQRGVFVVPDAHADPRFRNLVHVTGEPWIRFWAGFPIEDDHGIRVGTLSVFDPKPRAPLSSRDAAVLRQLALQIGRELRQPPTGDAHRIQVHYAQPGA